MKLILSSILIALFAFISDLFLPWWCIAIIAFVIAFIIPQRLSKAFLSGFLGIFILWAVVAFWIDAQNEGVLSEKIARLLPLGGSSMLLILVTSLVGGLVGGFASMAGSSLRPRHERRDF